MGISEKNTTTTTTTRVLLGVGDDTFIFCPKGLSGSTNRFDVILFMVTVLVPVVSFSKKLYPHGLVLVSSRNWFDRDLHKQR